MTLLPFLSVASFSLLFMIQSVLGHGFVQTVNIGGKDYPGWSPFNDPYAEPAPIRVIRKIKDDGPVPGTDSDLACGIGGNTGTSLVAEAAAGSQVYFKWGYWPADHQGPVSTYMTSCEGDCANFSADSAKWFKIDAGGYDPATKQWAADKLRANGNTWTSTIPAELKAGDYLMRNEIVALHSQTPQFYPSCAQVRVTGPGSKTPSSNDLVSILDVYSGVNWPFIYGDFGNFTIPGPPPVSLGDNSGTGQTPRPSAPAPASQPSSPSTASSGIPEEQSPATSSAPSETGRCGLKSRRLVRKHLARHVH